MNDDSFLWAAALMYGTSFLTAVGFLIRGERYPQWVMVAAAASGLLMQTAGLYQRGLVQGHCPLGNPTEILQFVAWSTMILYLVVGPAFRVSLLGMFASGLVALLSILSLSVPGWDHAYTVTPFGITPLAEAHAALALFSYGVFGLLAATSGMYLMQSYGLGAGATQRVFQLLPSIVELEKINFRLLILGTLLFSLAMAMGAWGWLAKEMNVPGLKLTFAVVVWVAYGVVFAVRSRHWLIARPFAWSCLFLFGLALLTLWPVDAARA